MTVPPKKWRNSRQLRAYRAILDKAARTSSDGATVTLDITTAMALAQICAQAEHTERNHEHPGEL